MATSMASAPPAVPDFVIAGAPKCGTTALYSYLSTHPGIAMASRKEPYYWCPDVKVRAPVANATDYADLWRDAPAGALRGEATPAYLRSKVAAVAILEAQPRAKFIVMLRNPAEMAASFHAQMLVSLQEDVVDFETAWRLQAGRAHGQRLPGTCYFPPNLQYAEVCALGDQLERLLAVVPREQVRILYYDDLRADARAVYLDVLRFLDLPDDGREAFDPINRNQQRRAMPLVRLYGRLTSGRLAAMGSVLGRLGVTRLVERLSLREKPRAPVDPAFDRELRIFFRPQVEKIEALLGRDLTAWKTPS